MALYKVGTGSVKALGRGFVQVEALCKGRAWLCTGRGWLCKGRA